MSDSLVALVTALADDELVLGHRHSEWTGFAPHIEEDVAFSSIAQDEIGHAAAFYSLVAQITGDDPDRLGLGRDKGEYRHAILCERPNREWAYSLARHWLYDHADDLRLEALEDSAHGELRALATKIRREERYHLMHADAWIGRISQGPVEGRAKLIDALTQTFSEAVGLFEPYELEAEAVKEGWLTVPSDELGRRFSERAARALDEFGLPTDVRATLDDHAEFIASSSGDLIIEEEEGSETVARPSGFGGRRGNHSGDFDEMWEVMTKTYRAIPGASW
jgi:ring-1,2-phenylacetyl-CoA epoxidase subunit PaaC